MYTSVPNNFFRRYTVSVLRGISTKLSDEEVQQPQQHLFKRGGHMMMRWQPPLTKEMMPKVMRTRSFVLDIYVLKTGS